MNSSVVPAVPGSVAPRVAHEGLPLQITDLSGFAKSLRSLWLAQQAQASQPIGHVQLLNLLARAAGHRNVQALKAQVAAQRAAAARSILTST